MLTDLRYALRTLGRSRAFTLTAIATLALGIGANTAMFGVVNAVLLRPLPYANPDRLMLVAGLYRQRSVRQVRASALDFSDWRRGAQSFDGMAAHTGTGFVLSGDGDPELAVGQIVTEDLFRVLGVQPAVGRAFAVDDFTPGRDRVVLLGHGLWQRRFGGDRAAIGRTTMLNGRPYVIVGVMPPRFAYPSDRYQLWAPLSLVPSDDGPPINRGSHYLQVVARLKPGVTEAQAQLEMDAIAAQLEREYPDTNRDLGARVFPLRDQIVGDVRPALLVLLGAVGFVVLIACGNVTNLLLARASGRQREIAIRAALGAARLQVARQLFVEALLLYAVGAAAGVALASWGLGWLVSMNPANIPRLADATIDARVLTVTSVVALVTALVFGLAPAIHASRVESGDALRAARTAGVSPARQRLRAALVVGQLALSIVLLVGAGLALRSFARLTAVDPGFDPDGQLTFGVVMQPARYPTPDAIGAFGARLVADIASVPGVSHAGATTHLPFSGQNLENAFTVAGFEAEPGREGPIGGLRGIAGDYFAALGIPLKRGRPFTSADQGGTAPVAIVNDTFARRYWPNQDPIGKRMKVGRSNSADPWRTVVGVVGDVKHSGPTAETRPEVNVPFAQLEPGVMTAFARGLSVVVRAGAPTASLLPAIRERVRRIDDTMPLIAPQTVAELASDVVAQPRFRTVLLGVFAALALTLASVGVFGVLSYSVTQRTLEIGVRIALGAQPSAVLWMVVGRGLALAATGIAIGLAAAVPLATSMRALLFEVPPLDAVTFCASAAGLAAVAGIASYLPARRATRIDPIASLREP